MAQQPVYITLTYPFDLSKALDAARTLQAKRVSVRAGGTWQEAKVGGELIFGPVEVVRQLRGGQRFILKADGRECRAAPWHPEREEEHKRLYLSLEIVF